MAIKHRDHRHDTVAQVRACEFGSRDQATIDADEARWDAEMQRRECAEDERVAAYKAQRDAQYERNAKRMASTGAYNTNGADRQWASERQLGYIKALLLERDTKGLVPATREAVGQLHEHSRITKAEASDAITDLLAQPKKPKGNPQGVRLADLYNQVPDGRYAVEDEGTLKFYRVDTAEAGHRWMMVQASDELHRIGFEAKLRVLAEIAKDPQEAMLRYGKHLGHCGHCGRTLTNEESRQRGIGPICAGKMGWAA